ncbi:MAG: carboxypeptidase regulatory-like domain-containing protein, partial [Acidobacteriota bacterium]|nr:carboxypeptidase regulatory-like domain-containing protein [Acidobacteriota bacterium]
MVRTLVAAILVLVLVNPAGAQAPSGEISGVVVDSSGSAVPGVRITLINQATNAVRDITTNESGLYVIPAIPPGTYALKAELTGFRSVERRDIELQVGSANRIPITLEVGDVNEVLQVAGRAPLLQTETASIGTVIDNRTIVGLPLNGRNYLQLASLIPGATTNGPSSSQGKQRMGGQRNSFALNVAGQRVHFNHYSLDGVENTDLNFNSYMLLPSVDALQEFKVESGLFDAEYGRAIAQINASTKSGTNQLRGSVFQFHRNSALDAKNYFDPKNRPIPPFRRNQYGLTTGGPVVRNRLFFMVNWEGLRERKSLTASPSVPLTAWRSGDFSGLRDASGALVPIYDPATRVFDAAGNVLQAPTAFPNNVIPAGRIHPASKKLAEFYPLPEVERTGANFTNHEARTVDADQFTYRLDFSQSSRSNWFLRHSISRERGYDPFAIPNMGINTDTDVAQAVVGNTRSFGSNKVNDIRIGYGHLKNGHISPRANNVNVVADLGINIPNDNPLYWGVPNVGITGLSGVGEESDAPFINDDTTFQIVDNFSWVFGQHSVKFGGEVRKVIYDQIGGVVTRGRFAFDGRYTQNPLLPAAQRGGAAFADFLLGHFNRAEGQVGAPVANFRSNYFALFLQDSWKARSNLTVNYGLRWEYDQPFWDENDAIVNIDFKWDNSAEPVFVRAGTGDPFEGNPPFRLASDVQYVRDGRFGRGAYRSDFNDFAPRVGIAWAISPKTVIRSGGGIYYVRDIGNAVFDTVRNAPFTIRRDEPAESFRPNLSFEQPFARTGAPTFILANQYDEPSTYIAQWSLGAQRELSEGLTAEATYFGSAGVHLRRLMSYNNPEPSQLANSNLARPFPKFGSIQVMNAPGHSSYHALYLKLQRRFSRGFTFLSSFSWGKSIDNGSGIRTTDGDPLTPSNNYDLDLERGLSAFDFRRRLTTTWLWELPFGRDKHWMNEGGVAAAVLGGWQFGGILTLQDGFPFTVTCGPGNIQNGGGICYPDSTGVDWRLARNERTRTRYFNTEAFVDRNPAGGPFRYGTVGRNSLIGPGFISLDASANKKFTLSGDTHLELRVEAFNLPNLPIWNQPGSQLRTPNFGVINSTRLDSRQVQVGL